MYCILPYLQHACNVLPWWYSYLPLPLLSPLLVCLMVTIFKHLSQDFLLQLQMWRENQFHLVSGASRKNHGLQNMQDSYTAGEGMELLRQAIEHWAPRPHVVKYIVGEQCTDIVKVRLFAHGLGHENLACSSVAASHTGSAFHAMLTVVQGTKQAGKRKASALNGILPGHCHFPDAAASVSQPDEQPESSTMPSSATSGEESSSSCTEKCDKNQCMLLLPLHVV